MNNERDGMHPVWFAGNYYYGHEGSSLSRQVHDRLKPQISTVDARIMQGYDPEQEAFYVLLYGRGCLSEDLERFAKKGLLFKPDESPTEQVLAERKLPEITRRLTDFAIKGLKM